MDYFIQSEEGEARCEDVPLSQIASRFGTPCYVYSRATLDRHIANVKQAFSSYPTTICYAVKANSHLRLMERIFQNGYGADIVSLGELVRARRAGVAPADIVFSGVGKERHEIEAALQVGIRSFNVESLFELDNIAQVAGDLGLVAPVSLRLNPNVDAQTNPKITTGLYSTKFGLSDPEPALEKVRLSPHLELVGLACHIGSQMTTLAPMREACRWMVAKAEEIKKRGFGLRYLNMGGGLGIRYSAENPPSLSEYADALIPALGPTGLELIIEPGRVLMGNVGILLAKVIGVKETPVKRFVILDAGMNDLMRPSLYGSYHEICSAGPVTSALVPTDVVGPICETGDTFGEDRNLPALSAGDLVFIRGCGAYGATMTSNYNSRGAPAEVLVSADQATLITQREPIEAIFAREI